MANPWEQDQIVKQDEGKAPWEKDALAKTTAAKNPWEQDALAQDTRKAEDVGAGERIGTAFKRGFESLGDVASGLGLAKTSVLGTREETAKKMAEIKKEQEDQAKGTPTLSAEDIERIYKEKGLLSAAGNVPSYIAEQFLQSAPQMAGPLAVGAAASPFITPIGGAIAGIATYGIQQFGNFLVRQAQEKKNPEELEVAKAALAAAGTAPIGYYADKFTAGIGGLGKSAGKEVLKELAARRVAGEIGAGTIAKEVGKSALKGAAEGIIAEAPTEVLEQAAERWQAGLDLTGDDAMREYKEAFFGAAAVGGALGGAAHGAKQYGKYRGELADAREAAMPGTSAFDQARGENGGNGINAGATQLGLPGIEEQGGTNAAATNVDTGDMAGSSVLTGTAGEGTQNQQAPLNATPAATEDDRSRINKIQELEGKIREAQNWVKEVSAINPEDERLAGAVQHIEQLNAELNQLKAQQPAAATAVNQPPISPAVEQGTASVEDVNAQLNELRNTGKPLAAPVQAGFDFGAADENTQRGIPEDTTPKAKVGFFENMRNPLEAVTNFLSSLKPDTTNPQQVTNYNAEVKGILEDLREFFGQPAKMVQGRFPDTKVPDVAAGLSSTEAQIKPALLDAFFDKASLVPGHLQDSVKNILSQLPTMNVEQQKMALSQLFNFPKLNTIRGIKDFRAQLDDVLTSYEQHVLGEDTSSIPFSEKSIQAMTPRIMQALTALYKTARADRSPEENAAYIYFTRKVSGIDPYVMAMRCAAYDLGVQIDNKFKGAIRKGETKENAELFKKWIEDNLPQQEYRRFMATVKEFERMTRRGERFAEKTREEKATKKKPEVSSAYESAISRKPSGKESGFDKSAAIQPGMGKFTKPGYISFAPMHPAVQAFIDKGDINGALNALAGDKSNYLGRVAARLAQLGLNTSIQFNGQEKLVNDYLQTEHAETHAQLNRLLEAVYPELYKTAFKGKDIRDTQMALKMLKDGKFKGVDVAPMIGQVEILLEAYNDAVRLLDTPGTYFPHLDAITLNTEFGGASNYTFIHEVTHAATSWALDPNNFDKLSTAQQRAVGELNKLWEKAQQHAPKVYDENGKEVIPSKEGRQRLKSMFDYGIKNIDEFVAEAMSNRQFQEQLRQIKYEGEVTLWDKFVRLIAKVVGFDNVLGHTLANANIILQAPPSLSKNAALPANKAALSALSGSRKVGGYAAGAFKILTDSVKGRPGWEFMKASMPLWLESLKDATRQHFLGAFTLRQLQDMIGHKLPQFKGFINETEAMLDDRNHVLNKTSGIAKLWQSFQANHPKLAEKLNLLMIDATVDGIDPSLNNGNTGHKHIDEAWHAIGTDGQKIFTDVKAFYEERLKDYVNTILERKAQSLMAEGVNEADVHNHPEYQKIADHFNQNILRPYFPLRRFGKYWVMFGKGKDKEFYQFESAIDRNIFAAKRKKELNGSKEMDMGNNIKKMVESNIQDLTFLKELKDLMRTTQGDTKTKYKENLEESLEQLYLMTLPDRSVRKMFLNRQGIQGMNSDMQRAFVSSAFHMAYQHSRFKHSANLYNLVDASREYMNGQPAEDKKVLRDYINELEHRLNYIMNPPDTGTIPGVLSNASFIWYMTAPASALVNMLGVPAVGIPVIGAKFGNVNASKKVLEFTKKFTQAGFRDKDGKMAFPSLSNKDGLLTPAQQKAYDQFVADGLIDITLQHDLVGMAEAPSNLYTGRSQRVMQVLSGAFHGAEKFNREVVAMSSFDLAMEHYAKPENGGYKGDKLVEKAIEVAKDLTYKSMFDYSTLNKPRYFQSAGAKVVLQFKQFGQQMTYMLARSAYEGFAKKFNANEREDIGKEINATQRTNGEPEYSGADLEKQIDKYIKDFRKEGQKRLMGTLGTTFAFAGVTGMPGWWAFSKMMEALHAVFGDDDDDEKPFDFNNWFKNWCAETFGGYVGDSISRGVVSQTVGLNVADRMSLNDLWFRDPRNSPDETAALQSFLISLMGPSVGLGINVADAMKQFREGHVERSMETMSPAVLKDILKGMRISDTFGEGKATNLKGNVLIDNFSIGEVLGQSIGFGPERLAQKQQANIEMKSAEMEIKARRQALLNAFFMSIDGRDSGLNKRSLEKISHFNNANPGYAIKAEDLTKSVLDKYKQRALSQATGGMNINKKLIGELAGMGAYGNE